MKQNTLPSYRVDYKALEKTMKMVLKDTDAKHINTIATLFGFFKEKRKYNCLVNGQPWVQYDGGSVDNWEIESIHGKDKQLMHIKFCRETNPNFREHREWSPISASIVVNLKMIETDYPWDVLLCETEDINRRK